MIPRLEEASRRQGRRSRLADGWTGLLARQQESRTAKVLLERVSPNGRGERVRADTPSPILMIPVTNIPSYVGRVSKTA
jgi:hypothetical protein